MKVLMLLTSHDQLGNTGRKTGFWLEEMAAPYYVFKEAGAQITLASPKGGRPPLDPKFTNGEEEDVGLTKVVPFLVEDELLNLGATFSKVKNWGVHTVVDGQLITGQNPASSGGSPSLPDRPRTVERLRVDAASRVTECLIATDDARLRPVSAMSVLPASVVSERSNDGEFQ